MRPGLVTISLLAAMLFSVSMQGRADGYSATGNPFPPVHSPGGGDYLVTGEFGQSGPPLNAFSYVQAYEILSDPVWPHPRIFGESAAFWASAGEIASYRSSSGGVAASLQQLSGSYVGLPMSRLEVFAGAHDELRFTSDHGADFIEVVLHWRFDTTTTGASPRAARLSIFSGLGNGDSPQQWAALYGEWNAMTGFGYSNPTIDGVMDVTVVLPANTDLAFLSRAAFAQMDEPQATGAFSMSSGLIGITLAPGDRVSAASGLTYAMAAVPEPWSAGLLMVGLVVLTLTRRPRGIMPPAMHKGGRLGNRRICVDSE